MYDIYIITADNVPTPYIVNNLQQAVDKCNELEDAGYTCELHQYTQQKILSRTFWRRKKNNQPAN